MRDNKIFAKQSKCSFNMKKVEYLGHVITEVAFVKLKQAMMEAPVRGLPDSDQDGNNLGNVERYLLNIYFKTKTDHFRLKYLLIQKLTTPFQLKWIPKLLGYDYEIVYKRGVDNAAANALSRPNQGVELPQTVVSLVASDVMDKAKEKQENDKIGTKPNKNGKRGKAQQCQSPVTVEKAEKKRNTDSRDQYWQILKVVLIQEQRQGLKLQFIQRSTKGKQEEKKIEEEQAANARYWKIPACCDDDYSAITPNEPVESLSMGDEHLNTISATKSDKFIESCVENLVPNPSESEGESECDMPARDYEFDSSDDQSCSDEDVPEKFFSNPLFEEEIIPIKIDQHHDNAESTHDSSLIFLSKIDSLLDEFVGELTLLKAILPGINKTDCHPENEIRLTKRLLYDNSSLRPTEEFVSKNSNIEIESFSPSPIPIEDSDSFMEEIDLSFNPNDPMPPGIEDDDDDSERDILILKDLPSNYSLSLPKNESFHFDIPSFSRPLAKPPDGNTRLLNIKMMGDISEQKVPIHGLMITLVSNQEKSPDLLSHRNPEILNIKFVLHAR
nr:putative mitochondrial protein [Tanacetum cinerariifolium]